MPYDVRTRSGPTFLFTSRAGLRGVLPAAFRNKEVGAPVDQIVDPWRADQTDRRVRRRHADLFYSSDCLETALLIGVSLAPALYHSRSTDVLGPNGLVWTQPNFYREKRIPKKRGGNASRSPAAPSMSSGRFWSVRLTG